MSKIRTNNVISKSKMPRHGHVFSPASRAYFAWQAGELDEGTLNQRESGKFFPTTAADQLDVYAKQDTLNAAPPPDGKIASANQLTGAALDAPGSHWQKHEVRGGEALQVAWHFTANHATRRWNYFMTKEDWNPERVLSRDQFEAEPFYTVQINLQPFWEHTDAMMPSSPTVHDVPLPQREGYHVLLAVWEVANTGNAFYQVIDLDFLADDAGEERPTTPSHLMTREVTDKHITLTWGASTGPHPIAAYRLIRNGSTTVDVIAPLLSWMDNSVRPETLYTYFISAIDELGNMSTPSRAIEVITPAEGGENAPPTAPKNLHSMGQTSTVVSVMWGASTGPSAITQYLIYRNDQEIARVKADKTSFDDTGLTPNTQYRYYVTALDERAQASAPSNVLSVKTEADQGGGEYPLWALNTKYLVNERVSHNGKHWQCLQAHISNVSWAPGQADTLWTQVA